MSFENGDSVRAILEREDDTSSKAFLLVVNGETSAYQLMHHVFRRSRSLTLGRRRSHECDCWFLNTVRPNGILYSNALTVMFN